MDQAIAIFIERALGVSLLLIGASHCAQAKLWGRLLAGVLRRDDGALIIGTFSLPIALLIVIGHPAWTTDGRSLVTLCGWLLLAKCVVYLLAPRTAQRFSIERMERGGTLGVVGVVMMAAGAVMLFASWRAWS